MRIAALLIPGIGLVSGVYFQATFFHAILAIGFGVDILAPVGAFLLLWALFSWRRGVWSPWLGRLGALWGAVVLALIFSVVGGNVTRNYNIHAAREYVARAVPVLDEIKKREGRYPERLPEVALGRPPRLLRSGPGYSSDGAMFRFEYSDPNAMMGYCAFYSTDRKWTYFD